MQVLDTNIPASRRQPVRLDGEDGPWSVSVAEAPNESSSYSLYIKTPTHNLTLTRTAVEILDLDRKLRDSNPIAKIPLLPIDAATLPKRKNNFLNTLSRLASPASNKNAKTRTTTAVASSLPTPPLTSPASEAADPFTALEDPTVPHTSPSATSTAIAAYLTTISNAADLRKDRVWKRFVRVRTDDLESVRVERAIKRVRSDLAAHTGGVRTSIIAPGGPNGDEGQQAYPTPLDGSPVKSGDDQSDDSPSQLAGEVNPEPHTRDAMAIPADVPRNDGGAANGEVEAAGDRRANGTDESTVAAQGHPGGDHKASAQSSSMPPPQPPQPSDASTLASRIPRSQSCEPDKSHRMSRAYAASTSPSQDGDIHDGGLSSQFETGDESSLSVAGPRRRKKKQGGKKASKKVTIDDFEMMRVLGKGCAGKVLLVRHKAGSSGLYALKAITKRHVLAHQELQHTLTEQAVLKRMAAESKDPFVVKLWWSFHDKENLFLVMDFHPGGDLATQLARWGRLSRDRTRFYAAEIVEGVEGLHAAGVIYRDLKPENILIAADGHIVLTDFGLSKEFARPHSIAHSHSNNASSPGSMAHSGSRSSDFYSSAPGTPQSVLPPWMKPDKNGDMMYGWPGNPIGSPDVTSTFCGTAEYLAPEVIQGLPYGYEVDWWSFGTMLYEMLTGMTPFYANNHSDMYVRVLQDELQFPDERVMDQDTKSLIRGLLQKNPDLRIREPRIKKHPYFQMIDWCHVYYKRYIPPYVPPVDRTMAYDTQNFDETFLDMEPVLDPYVDEGQATDTDAEPQTDGERTDNEVDTNTTPSQSRSSSIRPSSRTPAPPPLEDEDGVDVFDGYSFKGRHSIIMDDDDLDEEDSGTGEDGESIDDTRSSMLTGDSVRSSEQGTLDEVSIRESLKDRKLDEEEDSSELEPKTPEARPALLPPVEDIVEPAQPAQPVAQHVKQSPSNAPPAIPQTQEEAKTPEVVQPVPQPTTTGSEEDLAANASGTVKLETDLDSQTADGASKRVTITPEAFMNGRHTPPAKASGSKLAVGGSRGGKPRREKSGVPALDKDLSDAGDDDEPEMTEPERDEEDEDWDFVEAGDGEDRNGVKNSSLWARGVVDRYKLSVTVFRKPNGMGSTGGRSFSMNSKASGADTATPGNSPASSPQRRSRGTGLSTFRKGPRQFLRPKNPPSSFPTNATARSFSSTGQSLSGNGTSASGATSMPSGSAPANAGTPPSLKSKPSAVSMDARSVSSDYSGNVIPQSTPSAANGGPEGALSDSVANTPNNKTLKGKKLKKYKNNAEKVLALFSSNSSPKQQPAAAS